MLRGGGEGAKPTDWGLGLRVYLDQEEPTFLRT